MKGKGRLMASIAAEQALDTHLLICKADHPDETITTTQTTIF